MEEEFYASIKLKSGEEIFSKVVPFDENGKFNLILTNPITISTINARSGTQGYKIEPWMKTTTEDMFIIKMDDIITITETHDIEMIMLHQSYVRKTNDIRNNKPNITREMGYIASVSEAKKLLEKIYKNS
jgi:small nuclear ribonucleoprotein (snRNP)-like protein